MLRSGWILFAHGRPAVSPEFHSRTHLGFPEDSLDEDCRPSKTSTRRGTVITVANLDRLKQVTLQPEG